MQRALLQRLVVLSVLSYRARAFSSRKAAAGFLTRSVAFQMQQPLPSSARFLSSSSSDGARPDITHVGIAAMKEIIEDYEEGGRDESQYCVIDVRTEEEVYATGKLGEHVYTLPVQVIMQAKVFEMEPEEFQDFCGFEKPTADETLVFTCAAGIRSVYACQFAAQAGYSKLVNYAGGANEWFSASTF
jgi:rhodanese-related sulfurtransferase